MKGQIKATFVDGTQYSVPLQAILDDMIKEEMVTGDICYDVAKDNVISILRKGDKSLIRHANNMEFDKLSQHMELVGCTPTRIKKKFGWKNAKKEVIHEQ